MTHPNEAVQLPNCHLLGPLHGLQDLLLVLEVGVGSGTLRRAPLSDQRPYLSDNTLWDSPLYLSVTPCRHMGS